MSGLMPSQTIRLDQTQPPPVTGPDVLVDIGEEPQGPQAKVDAHGNILEIEYPDGSISVSLDGNPLGTTKETKDNDDWFRNLVDDVSAMDVGMVAEELLVGIRNDLQSRQKWIEDRAQGLKLLGLSIEIPNVSAGASDGAPVEGMSRVRHPLLLEAVLRFQANARAEMLPTDGPVKVRNDTGAPQLLSDQLATALEKDMNHFLTSTDKGYYPDTDRMFLLLGFGGSSFKKVYFNPLRNRPVSESIDANDLIVNDAASDLSNALRVTHRVVMKNSTVKRLQILGVYRDISLSTPLAATPDSVQREKDSIQGTDPSAADPEDRNREIYECYCELDLKGFEHKKGGKTTGLEVPYRVTIDVSTREVLAIVRNYDKETEELPEARVTFVKYTFVPGMGFYDIGLLHILGNTTNALTAAWRLALDASMFASFPGFLFSDTGGRQQTNIFRVPPGGGAPVKTGGMKIGDAIMPLPYKDPSQMLVQMTENMAETGMRVGGTSELQVGEGRADAPVGTTLAMIDQATKVLNSVHKRMHAAQAEEFALLAQCFRDHPESFWQNNKRPAHKWDEETFEMALSNTELVPQADPNTASHGQRVMKIMGLKQLQAANPPMYDALAIDTAALQAMGWSNPQQFFAPMQAMGKPDPKQLAENAKMLIEAKKADASAALDNAKAQEIQAGIGKPEGAEPTEPPDPAALLTAQARMVDAQTKKEEIAARLQEARMEDADHAADRESKERLNALGLQKDHMSDMADIEKERIKAEGSETTAKIAAKAAARKPAAKSKPAKKE